MTAIIYFGEMVVALILAIFWLATSTFSMGKAVILFSGGAVALPSRPGEFHPEPLTDPDLILSHHPARAID
jgi:hypothetical protein